MVISNKKKLIKTFRITIFITIIFLFIKLLNYLYCLNIPYFFNYILIIQLLLLISLIFVNIITFKITDKKIIIEYYPLINHFLRIQAKNHNILPCCLHDFKIDYSFPQKLSVLYITSNGNWCKFNCLLLYFKKKQLQKLDILVYKHHWSI